MSMDKLRLKICPAFATVILLGSLHGAIAQGNLVFNGGFDAGVSGWTLFNVTGNGYDSVKGNPAGCFVLSGPPSPSICQTIDGLTPGTFYIVSGDYQSVGAPTGNGFGVEVNGSSYFYEGSVSAWQSFSFAITPDSTSVVLSLWSGQNGTSDAYRVDNITLAAVPEANSLCLFGLGGIASIAFLRRKTQGATFRLSF